MKELSKTKSIIGFVVFGVVFALLCVMSFVPMKFGSYKYESFFKAVSLSSEVSDTLSATYTIKNEVTEAETKEGIKLLGKLLENQGYHDANIYKVSDNQLRIDISKPLTSEDQTKAQSFLQTIGSGPFVIKNTNDAGAESSETVVVITGKHIKKITKIDYRGNYGLEIEFTKAGSDLYGKALGQELYMFVDGEKWPNSSYNTIPANTNPNNTTKLNLWFNSTDVIDNYYLTMIAGANPINLNGASVVFTETKADARAVTSGTTCSLIKQIVSYPALSILTISLAVIYIAVVVLTIIKQKMYGVLSLVSNLFITFVALFLFQLLPWVQFGVSTFVLVMLLLPLGYALNSVVFSHIKANYLYGKSIATSIADGYAGSKAIVLEITLMLTAVGFILAVIGTGAIGSIGMVIIVLSLLELAGTMLINHLLLKLYFSLNAQKETLFGIKRA